MGTSERYRSRKYALAVASMFGLHLALFTQHIDGGEYVTGLGLILGLYGASNVMEQRRD